MGGRLDSRAVGAGSMACPAGGVLVSVGTSGRHGCDAAGADVLALLRHRSNLGEDGCSSEKVIRAGRRARCVRT